MPLLPRCVIFKQRFGPVGRVSVSVVGCRFGMVVLDLIIVPTIDTSYRLIDVQRRCFAA